MRLGLGLGLARLRGSSIDPAAAAYFAATGLTGATEKAAVNTLVRSLKSAGLWSKMKAVYPFVTDNRNLLSYTEDFGNAAWFKPNGTVVTNVATAPNGTLTADTITPNTTTSGHAVVTNLSVISGSVVVVNSVYAKSNGYNYVGLSDNTTGQAVFNLSDGSIVSSDSGITALTPENVGNGWWRLSIRFTATTSRGLGIDVWNNSTKTPYAGNGTSGIYIWGAQLELGSTATTYQPIATTQQSYISNQFKYNLVNPVDSDAAFRGVFNGGWTFSNQGALPNGTNGYMDTKLNVTSNLSDTNTTLSIYSRTNNVRNAWDIGARNFGTLAPIGILSNYGNVTYAVWSDYTSTITGVNTAAYFIETKNGTALKLFRNSTNIVTGTKTSFILPTTNVLIGGIQGAIGTYVEFSNREYAFAHIGDGLTDTEATALYNAVQTFNSTLQRQV